MLGTGPEGEPGPRGGGGEVSAHGTNGGGEGSALHLLHARGRLRFSTREAQGGKQKAQGSQGPACRACLLPPPPRRPPPPGHSRSLAARPSPFALRPPRVSWGPGQRAAGCAWRRSRHCVTSQEPRLSTALPVVTEGELGCKLGCGHYTEATYRAPGGFTRSHGTQTGRAPPAPSRTGGAVLATQCERLPRQSRGLGGPLLPGPPSLRPQGPRVGTRPPENSCHGARQCAQCQGRGRLWHTRPRLLCLGPLAGAHAWPGDVTAPPGQPGPARRRLQAAR